MPRLYVTLLVTSVFPWVAYPYIIPKGLRGNNIIILLCTRDNQNIGTGEKSSFCLTPTSCMQFVHTYFAICVMFCKVCYAYKQYFDSRYRYAILQQSTLDLNHNTIMPNVITVQVHSTHDNNVILLCINANYITIILWNEQRLLMWMSKTWSRYARSCFKRKRDGHKF